MAAEPATREERRSRRKREVRSRTISMKRMTLGEMERLRRENPVPDNHPRLPRTRGECEFGPRPCPMVSCRYHLYLDVSPQTGAIKLNFPDLEVWELPVSCALDVADRYGATLEDAGELMNMTRERVRQIEVKALAKIEALRDCGLLDYVERGPRGRRRLPVIEEDGGDDADGFEDDQGDPPLDAAVWMPEELE